MSGRLSSAVLFAVLAHAALFAAPIEIYRRSFAQVCIGNGCSILMDRAAENTFLPAYEIGGATLADGTRAEYSTKAFSGTTEVGVGYPYGEAAASLDIKTMPQYAYVFSVARIQDAVTISYAPWNGRRGEMYIQYALDATATHNGVADAFAVLQGAVGGVFAGSIVRNAHGKYVLNHPFTFTYGRPFALDWNMYVVAGSVVPVRDLGWEPHGVLGTGDAQVNVRTASISGLILHDASGRRFTDAQVFSAYNYPYPLTPAPEPASSTLFATAGVMFGCAFAWKLRRRFGIMQGPGR